MGKVSNYIIIIAVVIIVLIFDQAAYTNQMEIVIRHLFNNAKWNSVFFAHRNY